MDSFKAIEYIKGLDKDKVYVVKPKGDGMSVELFSAISEKLQRFFNGCGMQVVVLPPIVDLEIIESKIEDNKE